MKRYIVVSLFFIISCNLGAVSTDTFKHDSQAFCKLITYDANVSSSLGHQFLFDSAKLVSLIEEATYSIDEVAALQHNSQYGVRPEDVSDVNKHIIRLNAVRKMLRRLQLTHTLPPSLDKICNFYRNSMDSHYYALNPSYESYILQRCNISLQELKEASLYGGAAMCLLVPLHLTESFQYKSIHLGAITFLAYKSYSSLQSIEYAYDLI